MDNGTNVLTVLINLFGQNEIISSCHSVTSLAVCQIVYRNWLEQFVTSKGILYFSVHFVQSENWRNIIAINDNTLSFPLHTCLKLILELSEGKVKLVNTSGNVISFVLKGHGPMFCLYMRQSWTFICWNVSEWNVDLGLPICVVVLLIFCDKRAFSDHRKYI